MIPRIIHQTVRNVNELTWEEKKLTKLSLKNASMRISYLG